MAIRKRELPYDPADRYSIVFYAKELVGKTLRESIDVGHIDAPKKRRGSFGNAVEEYYFLFPPNSSPEPDFEGVGLELKTTPLKRNSKGKIIAKERLVITMIDYMGVVHESFETSHLMRKASNMLIISYLWEPDKDPLDYVVEVAEEWGIPERDKPQIKADWETVVGKVRAGRAEDISGSDTLYLEACTKASDSSVRRRQPYSDVPAKPRAWALKSSYMTAVQNGLLERARTDSTDGAPSSLGPSGRRRAPYRAIARAEDERKLSLLDLARRRFALYVGLTESQLAMCFGLTRSKHLCARITNRILGMGTDDRIEEFEKAGIRPKTMRLKRDGMPKEAVSFPAFDYYELAARRFEDSDFYSYLHSTWLFVIYREDADGEFRLSDICFWRMPDSDIPEAKRCYDQMRANVLAGHAEISVKSTENRCCHVRPHGRDSRDVTPQPYGKPVVKKSFWLNQRYLAGEIERMTR